MTDSIHQEVQMPATPERVFEVLTDSAAFSAATGGAAEIDASEGGAFTCFDGMIQGRTIELVPGKRIVQAWRVSTWEAGVFSIVRFDLRPHDAGTLIVFDHTGYPFAVHEHLERGWPIKYWKPLTEFIESQ